MRANSDQRVKKMKRRVSLTGLVNPTFEKDCTKFSEGLLGNGAKHPAATEGRPYIYGKGIYLHQA